MAHTRIDAVILLFSPIWKPIAFKAGFSRKNKSLERFIFSSVFLMEQGRKARDF